MIPLWATHDLQDLFRSTGSSENAHLVKEATGVSIDTRTLKDGDLFVALKGPLADGHDHLEQAFQKGACGAIVSKEGGGAFALKNKACFQVEDTFQTLQEMGIYQRERTQARVAAVTGSYGKTSCKEALLQLLSRQGETHATKSSFNNHWGVPLSLASLPPQAAFGIFEIGTNHPGEIAPLTAMVRPQVALITTVATAHIANMGSVQAIAKEKASLFEGCAAGDVAVLNEESAEFEYLKKKARDHRLELLTFGRSAKAFARLKDMGFSQKGLSIEAEIEGRSYSIQIPVRQDHWALSALGVLSTISALGGNLDQAIHDFQTYTLPEGRGGEHVVSYKGGTVRILDESYNAGPASMQGAIRSLVCQDLQDRHQDTQGKGRRIAILAEMLELGEHSEREHRALAPFLEEAGVEVVYTVGSGIEALHQELSPQRANTQARLAKHSRSNDEMGDLIAAILADVQPGDTYLIKGSRGQRAYRGRLAQVVDALKNLEDHPLLRSL